jgi:hypothetical protein
LCRKKNPEVINLLRIDSSKLNTKELLKMKMIYHIFKADVYFLTLGLIESIIKFSGHKHFFVVVGVNESNKCYYNDLFLRYHYSQYIYINEKSSSKKTRIISDISKRFLKTEFHNFEIDLLKYIPSLSNPVIVLHGDYSTMFYLLLCLNRDVHKNWVCWGHIYFLHKEMNKRLYKIRNTVYKNIYSSYSNIICLMQPDSNELKNLYKLKNTLFLPYYDEFPLIIEKLKLVETNKDNTIRILLGNSGRCIDSYYEDLGKFKIYINNNISIDCMLNYGSTEIENLNLIKTGTLIYGTKFKAHTVLWPKEQYYNFMNKFDIYISSKKTQSGLGAIYLLLLLGKKVFLAGKNFEHIKNMGAIVFHSDQIYEFSFQDFSCPLTIDERKHNYSVTMKFLDCESVALKWDHFYDVIITQSN